MEKKRQHIIPSCYLKSWCDPHTPTGQSPYIWIISKDGTHKKKKSPEKSFTSTDRYTVKMPTGKRNLIVEDTLGAIEDKFINVLKRVRRMEKLNTFDRAHLCIFTAAMSSRTIPFAERMRGFFRTIDSQVRNLEEKHGSKPRLSKETGEVVEHTQQHVIAMALETMAPLLFGMQMSIVLTDDELGFITSDDPCVVFNPEAYKLPPMLRSPGLAQPSVEVTLPLTPRHLLFLSHSPHPLYFSLTKTQADECNRMTRAYCSEVFVSRKGETKPFWFEGGKMPDDSWENSEEGKRAMAARPRPQTIR